MKILHPLAFQVGLGLLCAPLTAHAGDGAFRHPGAFSSARDFAAIAEAVKQHRDPWAADFAKMRANAHDDPAYQPRDVATVVRGAQPGGPSENYANLFNDAAAAYALALDWRISGDERRGNAAVRILKAWAHSLRMVTGTSDRYLAAGIYGYQLAIAGETLRDFPGWKAADQADFRTMMLNVFAPMNRDFLARHNGAKIDHYWANWDLCNLASLMAIGILTDRRDLYEQARDYYLNGTGNGAIRNAAWHVFPGGLAQWQESGRDQGHSLMGVGLAGTICEMAWQQGDDLYGAYDNRLLAAARYVALYNLGENVPYAPYANSDVTQDAIAPKMRGQVRPVWTLLYNHYVGRKGLDAPELALMIAKNGMDGGGGDYGPNSGGFDELGYGTLTAIPSSVVLGP
ncbi:hypothetical protein FHW96_004631 [Novosphingobium sp. SG751A]|uniref:alginate lyase family protein n=1 Tax=Novosphingobium sp. SG751A TaxID=2587000 RepID=UPI0015577F31|nr:alginate lyase family protein [Novosphingobium sp. SG751A]NOW48443.1 hypothetical protein [Novosphingobium sp. SG751A]